MDSKNKVQVIIGGKVFSLYGTESEDYLQKIARFIDKKNLEVVGEEGFKSLVSTEVALLTSINIADDYFKEIDKNEKLISILKDKDEKIELLENEIIDLKHMLNELNNKMDELQQETENKMCVLQQETENKMCALQEEAENKISALQQEAENKISALQEEAEHKMYTLQQELEYAKSEIEEYEALFEEAALAQPKSS